jgi:hypothetical protein
LAAHFLRDRLAMTFLAAVSHKYAIRRLSQSSYLQFRVRWLSEGAKIPEKGNKGSSTETNNPLTLLSKLGYTHKEHSFFTITNKQHLVRGIPLVFFTVLALWVVHNAYGGKLREYEKFKGHSSQSVRQARMQEEQEEIMERIDYFAKADFDNTRRIKRPNEVLEERRKIRQERNKWYRRFGRWLRGES